MHTEVEGHIDMMDIANELVVIPKAVIDIFLKSSEPADLISLYTFYYYTAKWQRTNRIKATTGYCAKGLHWGEDRVRKAKKQLIDIGLVHDVRTIDKDSRKAKGWYIQITYIMKNSNVVEHLKSTLQPNPEGGNVQSVESEETNALSSNILNALSNSNETKPSKKMTFNTFKDSFTSLLKRNGIDTRAYGWSLFTREVIRLSKDFKEEELISALPAFEADEWAKKNAYAFHTFVGGLAKFLKPQPIQTSRALTPAEITKKYEEEYGIKGESSRSPPREAAGPVPA